MSCGTLGSPWADLMQLFPRVAQPLFQNPWCWVLILRNFAVNCSKFLEKAREKGVGGTQCLGHSFFRGKDADIDTESDKAKKKESNEEESEHRSVAHRRLARFVLDKPGGQRGGRPTDPMSYFRGVFRQRLYPGSGLLVPKLLRLYPGALALAALSTGTPALNLCPCVDQVVLGRHRGTRWRAILLPAND
jgi:hypothetical protein